MKTSQATRWCFPHDLWSGRTVQCTAAVSWNVDACRLLSEANVWSVAESDLTVVPYEVIMMISPLGGRCGGEGAGLFGGKKGCLRLRHVVFSVLRSNLGWRVCKNNGRLQTMSETYQVHEIRGLLRLGLALLAQDYRLHFLCLGAFIILVYGKTVLSGFSALSWYFAKKAIQWPMLRTL